LENEFNLLKKHNFEHYYELANFYKDNEYFKESIKSLKGRCILSKLSNLENLYRAQIVNIILVKK